MQGDPGDKDRNADGTTGIPHRIVAKEDESPIGQITWRRKIEDIFVEPKFRRQGVATGLLNYARELSTQFEGVMPPQHSEHRTEEGDAWAKAVDTDVPELQVYRRQYNNIWNE